MSVGTPSPDRTWQGIWLMIGASLVFAFQDGISRHLAANYNVLMVVMIRYWFFGLFVVAISLRKSGGLREVARSRQPVLQIFRALLLIVEICVMVSAFVLLGLVESHAVFSSYPLLVAALSYLVLGERLGWRRWAAIGVGFVGVLIILNPGKGVFSPYALIAVASSAMFALYTLLTRYVARKDRAETSFFWTGTVGAVGMTAIGIWFWEPLSLTDWGWMGALCVTGAAGHYMLIRCYEAAEVGAVQPFSYLQLVFASVVGVVVFGEVVRANVAFGAAIVVAAGIFTLWREHRDRKRPASSAL